jgi:hypothetical protein
MDFDTLNREREGKIAGIDAAIAVLKSLRDSYSIQSYPYCLRGDESSPAAIRRKMNSAWDKVEDGSK